MAQHASLQASSQGSHGQNHRLPIQVRLERFEGPLDLLLFLIQTHELDVSNISIGKITDQYLAYVKLMQELNFDIASEFLVMAATLLHWKSKAILPQENTQQDQNSDLIDAALTPEQLMLRLLEHQRYRAAGDDLASLPHLGLDFFVRTNKKIPNEKIWDLTGHAGKDMNITSLAYLYQNILIRQRKRKQILKKETVSLAQKITDFSTRLQVGKITEMQSLIEDIQHRPEVVVTFLASLELSRLKKMKVYQEKTYDSIYVELLESLQNFNATMATGFDSVMEAMGETATRPADTTANNPSFHEPATL